MEIVKMTANDVCELAELDKRCFSVPWSEKMFFEETENKLATYYLAKDEGHITGYCGFWIVANEGQITNIAVLPEKRGQGIATELMKKVISDCVELEQIILEVRESNNPAIKLYEKFGFVKAGIRKRFYHDPIEDGITMIRRN